jgi:hypothetical protein
VSSVPSSGWPSLPSLHILPPPPPPLPLRPHQYPATLPRGDLLALYRRILRAGAVFPSRNRAGILEEIRAEWRAGARAADPAGIAKRIETALRGLATLEKYTPQGLTGGRGGKARSGEWRVDLEADPLPAPPGVAPKVT